MVVGDVTINASPKSAVLGNVITFTGRVLIDGAPIPGLGISVYLDAAPAPPVFLSSGENDANGYYNIKWTSSYLGNLPIYAYAAAYQGFKSPTITVQITEEPEPEPETYVVGVAMYDGATDEYIIGTLIVDGVRYTGEQFKITGQMEEGVHTFNVEPPTGYTFVEWQVYEYGGPLLYTSKARPLSVNIDRHIWIWAEVKKIVTDIPTTLTISAPSSAKKGTPFNISGVLIRNDTGGPVPYASITLKYNGTNLGSTTTGVDGDYLKTVSINADGTFTLKATFAGGSGYAASSKTTSIGVGVTPTGVPYIAIVPIVVGLVIARTSR